MHRSVLSNIYLEIGGLQVGSVADSGYLLQSPVKNFTDSDYATMRIFSSKNALRETGYIM